MFSTIGYAICIPFAALLRLFYNLTGSYGVSLILFTAQEAARPEGPRFPQENGNRQRPQGPGPSPRQGPRPSVLLRNGPCGRHLNNVFRDGGNSVIPPSLVEFVSDVSNGRRQVAA